MFRVDWKYLRHWKLRWSTKLVSLETDVVIAILEYRTRRHQNYLEESTGKRENNDMKPS